MKLVRCSQCGDIFNLRSESKSCSCGSVYGRYIDNERAEVSGPHTAIAIGNGSFRDACYMIPLENSDWRYDDRYHKVTALLGQLKEIVPTIFLAWVRAPSGPTNSHTAASDA